MSAPVCPVCFLLFLFFMLLSPPSPTLFPYTTLFRSVRDAESFTFRSGTRVEQTTRDEILSLAARVEKRSEEHTSELQSPCNLVCRLLLEKKMITTTKQ